MHDSTKSKIIQARILQDNGLKCNQIAKVMGVKPNTITRWMKTIVNVRELEVAHLAEMRIGAWIEQVTITNAVLKAGIPMVIDDPSGESMLGWSKEKTKLFGLDNIFGDASVGEVHKQTTFADKPPYLEVDEIPLEGETDDVTKYVYRSPVWSKRIDESRRMLLVSSGRGGGGKTLFFGLECLRFAVNSPNSVVVAAREVLKDLTQSTIETFKNWIRHPAAPWSEDDFEIKRSEIVLSNGSRIYFRGLSSSSGTGMRIKSMEGVDLLWCDEAQDLTDKTVEVLLPTIRKEGSRIWLSYNPMLPTDPVSQMSVRAKTDEGAKRAQHIHLHWHDNPWFVGSELDAERKEHLRVSPESYAHVWEGEFYSASPHAVISYHEFMMCVRDWDAEKLERAQVGAVHSGFDIAVTEKGDKNALVMRQGGVLVSATRWPGSGFRATVDKLKSLVPDDLKRMYYDSGGVGGGFSDMFTKDKTWPARLYAITFGGAVKGKGKRFSPRITNEMFFARRNSQLYWAVRLRVKNTLRLLAGEKVNPAHCLLIQEGSIDLETIQTMAAQISTAQYLHNKAGKVEIDKAPDGADSPDLLDALVLAFANDSQTGLRDTVKKLHSPKAVAI